MTIDTARRTHNLDTVNRHLDAEFANEVEGILATVDPDPRFIVCLPVDGRLSLSVLWDMTGVEGHYKGLRQEIDVVRSTQVRRMSTDWYVFQQSVATIRDTAPGGTGEEFLVDTAVLFPVDHDGIKGEILWNPASFAECALMGPAGRPEGPAAALVEVVDRYDTMVEAWRAGDVGPLVDLLADDCAWATRNYGPAAQERPIMSGLGRAEITAGLSEGLAGWAPRSVRVLSRLVTGWYVFAELLWDLGDGTSVRTATISGVGRTGRIGGAVGWGTAPESIRSAS